MCADKIDPEVISKAPHEPVPVDSTAKAEEARLANENFKSELGWLGKFYGGRAEKPGNISGLVVCVCLILILLVIFFGPPKYETGVEAGDLVTLLSGIVTLTLGYLFGSNTKD